MSQIKTIFYKKSESETGDFFFDGTPYNEWFCLDGILYEASGRCQMLTKQKETNYITGVTATSIKDYFSDTGIIRRIALFI